MFRQMSWRDYIVWLLQSSLALIEAHRRLLHLPLDLYTIHHPVLPRGRLLSIRFVLRFNLWQLQSLGKSPLHQLKVNLYLLQEQI